MQPLVSILVPAYNAEKWLAETLQSAIDQTWPRKELIVIDDGSTDATLSIARRFQSPAVKVIAGEHCGKTATINIALKQAQGDFVQYLDADDILAPDKITIQAERLISEPAGTVTTCTWARFYNDDLRTAVFRRHADFRNYDSPVDWLIQQWNGQGTMPPVAWLLSRSVVEKAGPWNEALSLNDDTEYFTRIVVNSSRIAFCADAYGYYRSGNPSLSGRRSHAALESYYMVCELCTQHIIGFEDSGRTRQACANLWQHFVHWVYPEAPDLIRSAEAKVMSFGGANLELRGSVAFKLSKGIIGWKATRRLQSAVNKIRLARGRHRRIPLSF